MSEQEVACLAIVEALKADTGRVKKVDTWKKSACEALGIKKMGESRWNMILQHGYNKGHFTLNENTTPPSLNLPSEMFSVEVKPEVETEPKVEVKPDQATSDYIPGTNIKKVSATRVRPMREITFEDGTPVPRKGDVVWVSTQGTSWKGEVTEISVGVLVTPLNSKDGHWGYFKAGELFDTKKQADVNADKSKSRYWHQDAMSEKEYNLFIEYQKNKEAFLQWFKLQEDDDFDDLL